MHQYQASKTLAERAAWEFVEEKKGEIKFDLVSINPSWVSPLMFLASDGVDEDQTRFSAYVVSVTLNEFILRYIALL